MKVFFHKLESFLHGIGAMAAFVMMILITFDTAGRYLFNKPIQGTLEITELYLMIMVVFLTLSYSFKRGEHVRIDILYRHFSAKTKAAVDMISLLLLAVLFAIITYQGWLMTYEAWSQNQYTFGVISLPMVFSYIWVPLGSGTLTLRLLINFFVTLTNVLRTRNTTTTGEIPTE